MTKQDIVIVGAGGFAREVYCWAKNTFSQESHRFKGFLAKSGDNLQGLALPVLGDEESYEIAKNDHFLLAIGRMDIKRNVVSRLKEKGAQFLTLIHPTALIADTASIGEGVVICPFVTVCDHAILEDFVMMNLYASCGHDARIGRFSVLSPYATVNGAAIVGEEAFLGSHSTVALCRKVGRKAKVSANSAVMNDAPDGAFVFGVPGEMKVIF